MTIVKYENDKKKKTILWVIISIIIITLIIVHSIRKDNPDYENFVYNIDMKIVAWNYQNSLSQDKFKNPQMCNVILFEGVVDGDTLYREINTCDLYPNIHIDTEWIYNHNINDVVHFDYLKKDKFFKINDKNKIGHEKTK